jgi:DNA-directed RNA polymerase specialized sigma subunit
MSLDELDIYKMMQRLENVERNDVSDRLAYIEKQLKYFVFAATDIKDKFNSGIKLNVDENTLDITKKIQCEFKSLFNTMQSEVLSIRKLKEEIQHELKNESIIGAIKFMAKALQELIQDVHTIKEEGIKKNIHFDLTMDGYEMVKRKPPKINSEIEIEEVDPELATKKLLATLTGKECTVLIHRYGLFGEKTRTLKTIGLTLGISRERVGEIQNKALRKCRHPCRRGLVENLTHLELRKAVLGE